MIPIGVYLVYLIVVLFCAGGLVRAAIERGCRWFSAPGDPLVVSVSDTLVLGWVTLAWLTSLVSLVHPITGGVHVLFSAFFLLGGAWPAIQRCRTIPKELRPSLWFVISCGVLAILGLTVKAAGPLFHSDTCLYHLQMVKWVHEFGVVPGLANFDGRLGFNSSADVLAAFYDQFWFHGRSFHVAGLVLYVLLLFVSLNGYWRLVQGDRTLGTFLRCACWLPLLPDFGRPDGWDCLVALSTDWASSVFVLCAVILTAELVDWREIRWSSDSKPQSSVSLPQALAATLVIAFIPTIKLSAAPVLLLLPLIWTRRLMHHWSSATIGIAVAFLAVTPFVARNLILSGHLAYPVGVLDIFPFDWKVPAADVEAMRKLIRALAITPAWADVEHMDFFSEVKNWWHWRSAEIQHYFGWVVLGLVFGLGLAISAVLRRQRLGFYRVAIAAVLCCGVIFWVNNAPEPRLGMCWLYAFGLFPTACFLADSCAAPAIPRPWITGLGQAALLAGSLSLARESGIRWTLVHAWHGQTAPLWEISDAPPVETQMLRNEIGTEIRVSMEEHGCTYNAELPCAATEVFNPYLLFRGSNLSSGFKVAHAGGQCAVLLNPKLTEEAFARYRAAALERKR